MSENANLYARLTARLSADRACLELADGRRYRYADLESCSARAANALTALGLVPGDRVAVLADKSVELLWLYLGCLRAGLVYQPLNPGYTERELAFFLRDAGARAVVHDDALAARVDAVAGDCPALLRRLSLNADGSGTLADRWRDCPGEHAVVSRQGHDPAAMLYSSGTTGTPKGIALSHANLAVNAGALVEAWAFSTDDVLVHALPLYHVHGLFITLGPALMAGACLRFLPRFDVGAVRAALVGATILAGVPTYYTRLLDEAAFGAADCTSVRVFISGSAPLSEQTFHAFEARTGCRILERYGMTETGILTSNPVHGPRKPGAVGRPLAGVELRVTGAGAGVPAGTIGDIEVRGPNVFAGYWGLPDKTAEAFTVDGWFRTGDQGVLDDDGYLHLVGRSKDLVITGGLNVYPKEVETELERQRDIAEAAVFGVPHPDFGEAVVAAVTLAIPLAGAACAEPDWLAALKQVLAGYKLPKRILVVDQLPRNSMGKVQKNLLRERYAELFAAPACVPPADL